MIIDFIYSHIHKMSSFSNPIMVYKIPCKGDFEILVYWRYCFKLDL